MKWNTLYNYYHLILMNCSSGILTYNYKQDIYLIQSYTHIHKVLDNDWKLSSDRNEATVYLEMKTTNIIWKQKTGNTTNIKVLNQWNLHNGNHIKTSLVGSDVIIGMASSQQKIYCIYLSKMEVEFQELQDKAYIFELLFNIRSPFAWIIWLCDYICNPCVKCCCSLAVHG